MISTRKLTVVTIVVLLVGMAPLLMLCSHKRPTQKCHWVMRYKWRSGGVDARPEKVCRDL